LAIDPQNHARFLAGTTADYCDLISAPQDRSKFAEIVLSELRKAGIRDIALANLPEDSPTAGCLSRLAPSQGYHVSSRLGYICARLDLGSPEQRKQLKAAVQKKKSYRYSMNALGRQGPVALCHLTTWAEVESALPEFFLAHVARFLATQRLSNIAREDRRTFLTELSRLLSRSGWLALTRMTVGDRPVAWNFGFRFDGSWFYYQPTFETSLERYSPGVCLLSGIIAEACDAPAMRIVDLGLGAEGYKERFAHGARKTLYVTLSRSHAQHLRKASRYRLAEIVKRSPRVESSVRSALAGIAAVRRQLQASSARKDGDSARRSMMDAVSAREEILFYESTMPAGVDASLHGGASLVPLDFRALARAAMAYEGDESAQAFFLRTAQRLSSSQTDGFAVTDARETPVAFFWVTPFDGFFMEALHTSLSAPDPRAVLIFDGFMPDAVQDERSLVLGIAAFAEQLRGEGKSAWASVSSRDRRWARALEQVSFVLRYRMVSRLTPAGRKLRRIDGPSQSSPTVPITT
jgi:CelD/BcsL family acetyltransferase involved in cellulose biosynthesis